MFESMIVFTSKISKNESNIIFAKAISVAVNPLALLVFTRIITEDQVNHFSALILFGMMISIIFIIPSFRRIIINITKSNFRKKRWISIQHIQLTLISLCVLSTSLILLINNHVLLVGYFALGLLEYNFQERVRNYLYLGKGEIYARLLIINQILVISAAFFIVTFSEPYAVLLEISILICFVFINLLNIHNFQLNTQIKLLIRVLKQELKSWFYSISVRTLSYLDRIFIYFFFYDDLWRISIVSYFFLLPSITYDVFHLSPNRKGILISHKELIKCKITDILRFNLNYYSFVFLLLLTVTSLIFLYFASEILISIKIEILFCIFIFIFGWIFAFSDKIQEIILWNNGTQKITNGYLLICLTMVLPFIFNVFDNALVCWISSIMYISISRFSILKFIKG